MTNEHPKLRSHIRRRKNGKVTTYYFYDRRGTGEPDIALGTDYDKALAKWKEIHEDGPRVSGTIEEGFRAWEADEEEGLPKYENKDTRRMYAKALRFLRLVFGAASWDAVKLSHLTAYLKKRTAKTQANREMATFSIVWNYSRRAGLTDLPWPAAGMEKSKWKNDERARKFEVTDDLFEAVYYAGDQVLQDAMDLSTATGMRLTDVRTVVLPPSDVLRLKASKTGKAADFDLSLSSVLPELVRRRRALKADHLMLLSTPTGRPVSYEMLRDRYEYAREIAADNAHHAGFPELAEHIRAMYLRDMRKRASDLAGTDEEASKLLQHSSIGLTRKHYRSTVPKIKPVR
jgi:hypothetical protein